LRKKRNVEWDTTNVVDESEVRITEEENSLNPRYNPDMLQYAAENLLWPARYTEAEGEILDELRNVDLRRLLSPQEANVLVKFVVEKRSIAQIRDATGLSRQRVSQALKSAGRKIRRYLDIA
jgi:DNA-directed RNA polymerase specialized sigma24 family protein